VSEPVNYQSLLDDVWGVLEKYGISPDLIQVSVRVSYKDFFDLAAQPNVDYVGKTMLVVQPEKNKRIQIGRHAVLEDLPPESRLQPPE
jgi:hypothetical protein